MYEYITNMHEYITCMYEYITCMYAVAEYAMYLLKTYN